jgi:hypothetical protein
VLRAVNVQVDDQDVLVQFHSDSESEDRSFWVHGLALLEQVARICITARLDQKADDELQEASATAKKKAA